MRYAHLLLALLGGAIPPAPAAAATHAFVLNGYDTPYGTPISYGQRYNVRFKYFYNTNDIQYYNAVDYTAYPQREFAPITRASGKIGAFLVPLHNVTGRVLMSSDDGEGLFFNVTDGTQPYVRGFAPYAFLNLASTGIFDLYPTTPGYFFSTGNGIETSIQIASIAITAVPEPATWALMLLGLGAVGVMVRRQRQQTIAVTYS